MSMLTPYGKGRVTARRGVIDLVSSGAEHLIGQRQLGRPVAVLRDDEEDLARIRGNVGLDARKALDLAEQEGLVVLTIDHALRDLLRPAPRRRTSWSEIRPLRHDFPQSPRPRPRERPRFLLSAPSHPPGISSHHDAKSCGHRGHRRIRRVAPATARIRPQYT